MTIHWHLSKLDWIGELPEEAVRRLREGSLSVLVGSGEMIFAPEVEPGYVFVLETGLVRMLRITADGREFTLGYILPGEVFGESAAFDKMSRESFAQAAERSRVLRVPRGLFLDLLHTYPDFGFGLTKQIEHRFKRIETRAEDLVFRPVMARLAHVILTLEEDFGAGMQGRRFIRLHLTQAEFATLVGASRPSVNQAFRDLRTKGLAAMEKGHVVILDQAGLRRLVETEVAI